MPTEQMRPTEPAPGFPPNPLGIPETPDRRAKVALRRLRPELADHARQIIVANGLDDAVWATFSQRLDAHFPTLYAHFLALYAGRDDLAWHTRRLLIVALESWLSRPADLRRRDADRDGIAWYTDHQIVAGVCYVDRFAGDLPSLTARIPYLTQLGIGLLHLMPLFAVPDGENDGGYAVSDYRTVRPDLGTIDDLRTLATELHGAGIDLALDFIFNHTASNHRWVRELRAAPDDAVDDEDQNPYLMFPDRTVPDAYDGTLREIFPETRSGSFSYDPGLRRWVWTTFNSFQWDLDYTNPDVFVRMAGEMLALANMGADVIRLDAVAFTWKQPDTSSESLPQVHDLVRAYNALVRIAAPAMVFLSEAIVHPDEVVSYIDSAECQLSYNPLQMALGWEALATRDTSLLRQSLSHRLAVPPGTAWLNYVRSHDDIGWTFDDADAAQVGINGFDHRSFLNRFYTGRFPGSFARGLPFQENPKTGDARVTGTTASLAGLDKALAEEGSAEVDLAIGRILALYGIAFALPGMPLIYLGDELATLNDHGYRDDPDRAGDSRWANRPEMAWDRLRLVDIPGTAEARVTEGLARLALVRRHPAFTGPDTVVHDVGDNAVFALTRQTGGEAVLILANWTERTIHLPAEIIHSLMDVSWAIDLLGGEPWSRSDDGITLTPYQQRWLTER